MKIGLIIGAVLWILIIFFIAGCGSTRTVTEKITVKTDTIYITPAPVVVNKYPATFTSDTLIIAEKKDSLAGSFIIKYYPRLNSFDLIARPAAVKFTSMDSTITITERPAPGSWLDHLEKIIIAGLVIFIILKK